MTREPAPVILPDGSAYLPDGRHITKPQIDAAVDLIARACAVWAALPDEVRAELEKEAGR